MKLERQQAQTQLGANMLLELEQQAKAAWQSRRECKVEEYMGLVADGWMDFPEEILMYPAHRYVTMHGGQWTSIHWQYEDRPHRSDTIDISYDGDGWEYRYYRVRWGKPTLRRCDSCGMYARKLTAIPSGCVFEPMWCAECIRKEGQAWDDLYGKGGCFGVAGGFPEPN